ncbi:sensor histidine kinase [bacterium]|nr:sensor histidine kinase [bacterium]
MKYAFPPSFEKAKKIEISIYRNDDNETELIVKDNGVGIPEGLNPLHTDSFGFELVTILVQDQLQGKIKLERERGTKFTIRFKS